MRARVLATVSSRSLFNETLQHALCCNLVSTPILIKGVLFFSTLNGDSYAAIIASKIVIRIDKFVIEERTASLTKIENDHLFFQVDRLKVFCVPSASETTNSNR